MSLDSLADNILHCGETPLWFPTDFDDARVGVLKKIDATLRITAQVPGPGKLTPTLDGFIVDENPLVSLAYNGLSHTLVETRLLIKGGHRLPGKKEPSSAEMQLYFKGTYNMNQYYCLVIPVEMGTGVGNEYFQTLSISGNSFTKRPSISTLVSSSVSLVEYRGADMRGRTKASPRPRSLCEPIAQKVNYIVSLAPVYISGAQLMRLTNLLDKAHTGPPIPTSAPPLARIQSLVVVIPEIKVNGPESVPSAKSKGTAKSSDGTVPVSALQCRRLDSTKDIKGDRIYIGGKRPGDKNLDQELRDAADLSKELTDKGENTVESPIKPRDIESAIAIVLGILVALVICATIAYFVLKFTYKDYLGVVHGLYKKAFKPAESYSLKMPALPKGIVVKICPTVPPGIPTG